MGSLLERVRAMEDKLENGMIMAQTSGVQTSYPQSTVLESFDAVKRPPMPKAVPEDIKMIVNKWQTVVSETSMPMKQYLKDARLSLGGDNKLLVVVEDGVSSDYFLKQEGHKELLEKIVSDIVGKEVAVTVQSIQSEQSFEQNYVDLSQIIHMEIEEE